MESKQKYKKGWKIRQI